MSRGICTWLPLLFCWWSVDHTHTTFLFCWCRTLMPLIDRSNYCPLRFPSTGAHSYGSWTLSHVAAGKSVCVTISADGLGKAAGGCTGRLSRVIPCVLTHGNPPHVLHRCKGLCASRHCMSMIPTLDVLQEGKSVLVCVYVSVIRHGLCNERS